MVTTIFSDTGTPDFLRALEKNFEGYVGGIAIVTYTLIILFNVFARTFLSIQFDAGLTLVKGLFTWLAWIAVAYGIRNHSHLRFLMIREQLNDTYQFLIYIVEWILWTLVGGIILFHSIPLVRRIAASGAEIVGINFPRYLLVLAVPVGMAFIILRTVQQAILTTKDFSRGDITKPETNILGMVSLASVSLFSIGVLSTQEILVLITVGSILLFLLGVPIILVFGWWVLGFHFIVPTFGFVNMASTSFSELQSFTFAALPLFIIVGDLVNRTNVSEDLIELARVIAGWLPGSIGNAALVTCGIFSAITGSNAATTASVGRALYPSLVDEGYDESYSAALIASGGTVGVILPPSLLLILYGVTFGISVPDLFLAAIIPGILMIVGLIIGNSFLSHTRGYGDTTYEVSPGNIVASIWNAKIGLGTIILLLGGIFAGIFTPSESAAVALLYILALGVLMKRLTSMSDIVEPILSGVMLMGVLIPLIVMSVLIQQNLSYLGIQDAVSNTVINLNSVYLIIFAMVIIMLISGSVLASVPNLVLTAPLLAPVAAHLGLSPITWAIVFTISDAIGFITPPYGLNLYVISGITDIEYIQVARSAAPYLAILIAIWLGIFLVPEINFLSPDPSTSPLFP